MLYTGAHHARELTSIHMNIYILLQYIYGYVNNCTDIKHLIDNHIVYFIPVVNVDGFKYISENFNNGFGLQQVRKNMNPGKKSNN
jgi:murein tripeptide amidase MpaA